MSTKHRPHYLIPKETLTRHLPEYVKLKQRPDGFHGSWLRLGRIRGGKDV